MSWWLLCPFFRAFIVGLATTKFRGLHSPKRTNHLCQFKVFTQHSVRDFPVLVLQVWQKVLEGSICFFNYWSLQVKPRTPLIFSFNSLYIYSFQPFPRAYLKPILMNLGITYFGVIWTQKQDRKENSLKSQDLPNQIT